MKIFSQRFIFHLYRSWIMNFFSICKFVFNIFLLLYIPAVIILIWVYIKAMLDKTQCQDSRSLSVSSCLSLVQRGSLTAAGDSLKICVHLVSEYSIHFRRIDCPESCFVNIRCAEFQACTGMIKTMMHARCCVVPADYSLHTYPQTLRNYALLIKFDKRSIQHIQFHWKILHASR